MPRTSSDKSNLDSSATSLPKELSVRAKLIVSLLVVFHLAGLLVALSVNVSPSMLQVGFLGIAGPYQVSTGQDVVMLPMGWTEAKSYERPLDIQVRFDNDSTWYSVMQLSSADASIANSRWSNFSRLLSWITEVEPSSQIVAEFTAQFAKLAEANRRGNVSQIRLQQYVPPSYEVYMQDPSAEEFETLFEAKVVRDAGNELAIVPVSTPELTSKPVGQSGASSQ